MCPELTDSLLTINRGGSMQLIRNGAFEGINALIAGPNQSPDAVLVTVGQFDTGYEFLYRGRSSSGRTTLPSVGKTPNRQLVLCQTLKLGLGRSESCQDFRRLVGQPKLLTSFATLKSNADKALVSTVRTLFPRSILS